MDAPETAWSGVSDRGPSRDTAQVPGRLQTQQPRTWGGLPRFPRQHRQLQDGLVTGVQATAGRKTLLMGEGTRGSTFYRLENKRPKLSFKKKKVKAETAELGDGAPDGRGGPSRSLGESGAHRVARTRPACLHPFTRENVRRGEDTAPGPRGSDCSCVLSSSCQRRGPDSGVLLLGWGRWGRGEELQDGACTGTERPGEREGSHGRWLPQT